MLTHKNNVYTSTKSLVLKQSSFVGHMGLAAMLYPNASSLLTLQLDFFFFTERTFPLVFYVSSLPPYKYSFTTLFFSSIPFCFFEFLPCLIHSKLKKFLRGKVIEKKPKIKEQKKINMSHGNFAQVPRPVVRKFLARPQPEGVGATVRRSIGRFVLSGFFILSLLCFCICNNLGKFVLISISFFFG